MDYTLSSHARDALEKRRIRIEWVERVLLEPEWTEEDSIDSELEHYLRRIPESRNRMLRVIVNTMETPARIVTVYFDQRRSNE